MEPLDFSLLEAPITSADKRAYQQMQRAQSSRSREWLVDMVVAVFAILLAVTAFFNAWHPPAGQPDSYTPASLVFGGLMLAIGGGFLYRLYRRRRDNIRFYAFAKHNNLTAVFDIAPDSEPGLVFERGHGKRIMERVEFPDGVQLGNYRYITGYARERKVHQWSYVRIPLARKLPHMVLDARYNNALGVSSLDVAFTSGQKLSLEGNFDQYFTLYAPKQYKRDALYVLTPDVMQVLIEHGKKFDIEIVDDVLYLYRKGRFALAKAALYHQLMPIITTISSKVLHQTDYYADEAVGDRSQNTVAAPGARLRRHRYSVITIVAFIIVIAVYGVRLALELL